MPRKRRFNDQPFGPTIERLMAERDVTYRALAHETGLSAGYLNHLVHGNRPVASDDVIGGSPKRLASSPTTSRKSASVTSRNASSGCQSSSTGSTASSAERQLTAEQTPGATAFPGTSVVWTRRQVGAAPVEPHDAGRARGRVQALAEDGEACRVSANTRQRRSSVTSVGERVLGVALCGQDRERAAAGFEGGGHPLRVARLSLSDRRAALE
jgi:hypothetical protein